MAGTRTARNTIPWFGWVTFAAVLLIVIGLLNVLEGLVALLQNQVAFIDGDSLVVVDLTGLGVVMLVFGGLLLAAGIGLLARNNVARIAAIAIVSLHALAQVGSLGAYPVWALLMITLDVIVLFALTVHWPGAAIEMETQAPGGTHRMMDRDLQQRATAFPVNEPTPPGRGVPAHAAPDDPSQSSYQQQSPYQQPHQSPQGPNAGPYPPGRPSSPAHAAPTSGPGQQSGPPPSSPSSGYGSGAV